MILPNQALQLVSGPAKDPVTLAEAKLFMRVDTTADDALITSLITAATRKAENFTDRFFITQTWDVWLDHIPIERRDSRDIGGGRSQWWDGVVEGPISLMGRSPDFLQLPRGPVQSPITAFKTYNLDDSSTAFTGFNLDNATDAARIFLKSSQSWPSNLRDRNAIQITTVYGYGDDETDVPSDIVTAIKILTSELYNDRGCGDCSGKQYQPNGKADNMNRNASCLLDAYTIERLD